MDHVGCLGRLVREDRRTAFRVRREFRIYAAGPITCPMEPSQALPFGVMAFLYREVLSHRGRWDVGRNAELRERWIRFEGRSIPWYVVAAEIHVGQ